MFVIDTKSNKPIYEQIIHEIKTRSMKGLLQAGDKLPSVRQLAMMLSVNPNTVSKAYSELEREGVIETIRGKGTFVCTRKAAYQDEEKVKRNRQKIKEVCVELIYLGKRETEIIEEVQKILEDLKKGE